MVIDEIRPYLRYVAAFSYCPERIVTVAGYDCRMFYIKSGCADIWYEDTKETLTKNTMLFIPSGVFYRFENFDGELEVLSFNFDITRREELPKDSIFPAEENSFDPTAVYEKDIPKEFSRPVFVKDAIAFYEKLNEIVREFISCDEGYREKSEALFTAVLIMFLRLIYSEKRREDCLVSEVREFLNEHYTDEFRAGSLESSFHYHPNYVNRVFKETTGSTIHSYLVDRRIEASKQLLVSSNLTIEEIAQRVGFKTHPHFSQAFRRRVGMSPKEYRLAHDRIIL